MAPFATFLLAAPRFRLCSQDMGMLMPGISCCAVPPSGRTRHKLSYTPHTEILLAGYMTSAPFFLVRNCSLSRLLLRAC